MASSPASNFACFFSISASRIRSAGPPAKAEARNLGARRFGLHTMIVSNERNYKYKVKTTRMLLDIVERVQAELDIRFEFVNFGGGLGIPYAPGDTALNLDAMATEIAAIFENFKKRNGYVPALLMESGRYMTGPHGVLVVKAINRKDIYRKYIGVDACMTALMRPALYGAYHHITVHGKPAETETEVVDVVGSLCENNDKFAIQRELPRISDGDILLIHDTGAHGQAMGFNYNGKLKPKELLLCSDGNVELIRREETVQDYFTTLIGFHTENLEIQLVFSVISPINYLSVLLFYCIGCFVVIIYT